MKIFLVQVQSLSRATVTFTLRLEDSVRVEVGVSIFGRGHTTA